MKKRSLLLILALTVSLATPIIFLNQTQPVYTQPFYINTHTYTFSQNLTTDTSIQINSNVTVDLGALIAGNVAGWMLTIRFNCYDPNSNITSITINREPISVINRGLTFPITSAFASDQKMNISRLPPFNTVVAFLVCTETVLIPSAAGFPSATSFNLSVTVELKNGNETISLPSDVPVVSLVLPNPSTTPPIVNYYQGVGIGLALLLPATLVLTDRWLKKRRIKKESVKEV
jgi:spore germination protein YaaH